jgi:hypothetical protein
MIDSTHSPEYRLGSEPHATGVEGAGLAFDAAHAFVTLLRHPSFGECRADECRASGVDTSISEGCKPVWDPFACLPS